MELYLDYLIREFGLLDLRGLSGAAQNISIPLEQVYVELHAERDNPTERDYDRRLLELDVRDHLENLGLEGADQQTIAEETNKVLARDAYRLLARQSGYRDVQGRPIAGEGEPVRLSDVVRRERRAIILGDPGSGKTTLLKYLAVHYARALRSGSARVREESRVSDPPSAASLDLGPTRLPIYVRIASYAEARKRNADLSMLDFLPTYWEGQQLLLPPGMLRDLFDQHIRGDKALILLDGLDEIASLHERQEIARQIEILIRTWASDRSSTRSEKIEKADSNRSSRRRPSLHPSPSEVGGNQVIVTSRIAGYHAAPLRDAIAHFTVQDMSPDAIDAFLRRWCWAVERRQGSERSESEQERRAEEQRTALAHSLEHPRIRRLAVNPLLLTLLALLNRSEGRLPRLRIELYENATRTLVETWRSTQLTVHEVVDILGPVALWIHTNRPTGLATERELHDLVTNALAIWRGEEPDRLPGSFKAEVARFIDAVRRESGLLLARGEGLFGFAHLTFQEYLVARQITRRPTDAVLTLRQRLADPRWREPLLLAVAQVAKEVPGELPLVLEETLKGTLPHDALLQRGLLFAAAALPECARVPPVLVRRLCENLVHHYAESLKAHRFDALRERVLAAYGPLRESEAGRFAEEVLCRDLEGTDPHLANAAADIVARAKWHTERAVGAVVRWAGVPLSGDSTPYTTLEKDAAKFFPLAALPLREAAFKHPIAWATLIDDRNCRDLVWLLYTNPSDRTASCDAEAITRDTPLTPLFTLALQATSPIRELCTQCRREWNSRGALRNGAGFILLAIGQELTENIDELESLRDISEQLLARVQNIESGFLGTPLAPDIRRVLTTRTAGAFRTALQGLMAEPTLPKVSDREFLESTIVLLEGAAQGSESDLRKLRLPFSVLGNYGPRPVHAAVARFCRVTLALTQISVSADEMPGAIEAGAFPEAPATMLDSKHIADLLRQLRSPNDETRLCAEKILTEDRKMSEMDEEVLSAFGKHFSVLNDQDPQSGYIRDTLCHAIAKMEHDDFATLDRLISALDFSTQELAGEVIFLNLVRKISPDVLTHLCNALPTASTRSQEAILWSFASMLEDEDKAARIESALVSTLETKGLDSRVRARALWACGRHPNPTVDFVAKLWRQSAGTSTKDVDLIACMSRLVPRAKASLAFVGDRTAIHELLAGLRGDFERPLISTDLLASKVYSVLPLGADRAGRNIVNGLAATMSPLQMFGVLDQWIEEDLDALADTSLGRVIQLSRELMKATMDLLANSEEAVRALGERALVRMLMPTSWLNQRGYSGDDEGEDPLAAFLMHIPDHRRLLRALVSAPGWSERLDRTDGYSATAAANLCAENPSLVSVLCDWLEQAADGTDRRNTAAVVAQLARQNPALLNHEMGPNLRSVLLSCCQDSDWESRRFAIASLSHLRWIGAEIGMALVRCSRDIGAVRQSALEAARRFQQFDTAALNDLFPELTGPSAYAAHTVALLLKELGTSRQAIEHPEVRDRIANALAAACVHLDAGRTAPEIDPLSETCYRALMEVVGT